MKAIQIEAFGSPAEVVKVVDIPDSERCTDGCLPSETKARRIKAGLSDELGIYFNFDPDSAGVGVQHGSCQQNGSESTRKIE